MATARTLEGDDEPAAAWKLIKEQRGLTDDGKWRYENLYDVSKVNKVPYLGGPRPGKGINVVGFPDLKNLAEKWFLEMRRGQEFLLVGPRGDGKSCKLRALASLLCTVSYRKVVCIWDMERASTCLVMWFVDALKFSYAEQPDVTAEIDCIDNVVSLKAFLERRTSLGDDFTFIIDGAQALDVLTDYGEERLDRKRLKAEVSLKDIVGSYKVIFGLSPEAWHFKEAERTFDLKTIIFRTEGFTKEQLQTFMQHASVLGAVVGGDQDRQRDVEYYAAKHPHSLDILDKLCIEIASDKRGEQVQVKVGADGLWSEPPKLHLTPEEVSGLLDSCEDWDSVISAFVGSGLFRFMRTLVQRRSVEGDFSTDAQIIEADPRYAYAGKGRFCTPFIQQIYVEEFRNKHAGDDHGAWVAYARAAVCRPLLNWSEAGWLCERLCNDVISRKGLVIDPAWYFITQLSSTPFSFIPTVAFDKLENRTGFMYMPIRYNYQSVDAVIFFRDTSGKLHIIGLQYTTNVDKHLHSESEFMSIRQLQKWYRGDILGATRNKLVQLDYVFVCTTGRAPEDQKEAVRSLRDGSHVGVLEHTRYVLSFEAALHNRVPADVRTVMQEMTAAREWCYRTVPGAPDPVLPPGEGSITQITRSRFNRLTRYEVDALAVDAGINPNHYTRVKLLKEKLLQDKVVVLSE